MSQPTQRLYPSETGSIQLNGDIPKTFSIPESEEKYTINYLGNITRETIKWLPFETMNLFCPEFVVGTLFIDYSNPKKPKFINEEVIQKVNFPDKSSPFQIRTYKEVRLSLKDYDLEDSFGRVGKPDWLQHDDTPVSPITNKKMTFLIQLDFDPLSHPYEYKDESYFNYPPWVYFFIEPETKLVAVILQSS